MIKYRCPDCGAHCSTSHCFDCDRDIPMSYRFDDETQSDPDDRLPFYARISGDTSAAPIHTAANTGFDKNIGTYLQVDSRNKIFKIGGSSDRHTFSDLLNFELCENNSVVMKGGLGRALVGGMLFGEAGAIVGASTRKSQNVVDTLYIRITLKSSGMEKISFICNPTNRDSITYRTIRKCADEVISELEIISAEAHSMAYQSAAREQLPPAPAAPEPQPVQEPQQPDQPQLFIADELMKLKQLLDMGVLTDEEFNAQKQKLLNL